jgi:TetR/AcrR family transcriptional regulator, repressor for uid operon
MRGVMGGLSTETSTRDRLLDAAVEVFSQRGYEGAGVQEIARRAGLTTGAIYANFRGKADLLFEAVGAQSASDLDDLFASRRKPASAGELLAELGSHLLDSPSSRRGLLIEAFVAARRDPALARLVRGLLDERADAIAGIVDRAHREGDVDDDVDRDALVRFAQVLALGSLLYTSLGLDTPSDDGWSSLIHRLVRSLKEES